MAKGNLFMGTGHGKVGDVVLYRSRGAQISRAYISRVSNPRSDAQMFTRVVASTLSKLYSKLRTVCDHSFEGKSSAAANMQEFMKVNNQYTRARLAEGGNGIGNFNRKDMYGALANPVYVSKGSLRDLTEITDIKINVSSDPDVKAHFGVVYGLMDDEMPSLDNNATYQDVVNALGVQAGDQISFVVCSSSTADATRAIDVVSLYRVILAPASGNMSLPFLTTDGHVNDPNNNNITDGLTLSLEYLDGALAVITPDSFSRMTAGAVITSRWEGNAWRRSNTILKVADTANVDSMADAIASWYSAVTSSKWLNQSVPVAEDVDNWRANIASLSVGGQSYPFDRALSWTITSATAVPVVITATSADLAANITAKRGNTALTPTTSGAAVTFSMNESGAYRFYYRDHLIMSVNFTLGE